MGNRHRFLIIFVIVLGHTFATRSIRASEPIPIAVLTFANQVQGPAGQDWDWLEKGLADLLINDLSTQPGLVLVDRERMQQTLDAMGAAAARAGHEDRLIGAFVERFKVSRLVFGSYRVDGGRITLNASVISAQSAKLIQRVSLKGDTDGVLKLQKQLSTEIIAILLGRHVDAGPITPLPIWTESLPATKLLYTAVDLFDQGGFQDAWLYARRAQRADPTYADALYWVGRLYYYMLRYEHARRTLGSFVARFPHHARVSDAVMELVSVQAQTQKVLEDNIKQLEGLLAILPDSQVITYAYPGGIGQVQTRALVATRLAQYYRFRTEYGRAIKLMEPIIADFLQQRKQPDIRWISDLGRDPLECFEELQMDIGVILGHPTTYRHRTARAMREDWRYVIDAVPWLLRPGASDLKTIVPANTEKFPSYWHCLLVIPPNYALVGAELEGEWTSREYLDSRIGPVSLTLSKTPLSRHGRGEINSLRENQKPIWSDHKTGVKLTPSGKLYHAAYTTINASPLSARWHVTRLVIRTQLAETDEVAHLIVQTGALSAFYRSTVRLNGTIVGRDTGPVVASFMPAQPTDVTFHAKTGDIDHYGLIPNEPIRSSRVNLAPAQTSVLSMGHTWEQVGPNSRPSVSLIAGHYSPLAQGASSPSVIANDGDNWTAAWTTADDIWMAESDAASRTWSLPRRMPVPINSAHREWDVRLIRLKPNLYVMVFESDRSIPRSARSYMSVSNDLKVWSSPIVCAVPHVLYAGAGLEGDLIFVGIEDAPWTAWIAHKGGWPQSHIAAPDTVMARSRDLRSFEKAAIHPHPDMPHDALLQPRLAWVEPTTGTYRCLLYHGGWGGSGVGDDAKWWMRLSEYAGSTSDGLSFVGAADDPLWHGYAVLHANRVFVMTQNRGALYCFDRRSLTSPMHVDQVFPGTHLSFSLSDIADAGALAGGIVPVAGQAWNDRVYMLAGDAAECDFEGANR